MSFISDLFNRARLSFHYRSIFNPIGLYLFHCYQNKRIRKIRKKKQISVLFIVGEASTWKSEILFQKMLAEPRFTPVLGVTESLHVPGSKDILIKYLLQKGYDFIDLDIKGNSIQKINPDIIFYYKPYELNYRHGLYFDYNLKSVICTVNYGFNVSAGAPEFTHSIKDYSWKEFLENEAVISDLKKAGKYTANKVITGIPLQDVLNFSNTNFQDPWKETNNKKRIIYAPHHSFKGANGNFIEYATFLEFGDFMLEMAKKYKDKVHWVFKPHPALKDKLIKLWGTERTESYFKQWENMSNSQIELGAYYDIFAHSDAMIHDCSSFLIEYLYADKPVLFLESESHTAEQMHVGQFGYDAYKAHSHASEKKQIEDFICQVISGDDKMKDARKNYIDRYLAIPNGKSASENIIDVILGLHE